MLPGFNDLATTHPEIAETAHFDPTTVRSKSHKVMPWGCDQGHRYEKSVANRTTSQGCPYCRGRMVLPGFNDLATTHPELALEAMFDATSISYGSGVRLSWSCPSGHEYQMTPNARSNRRRGCPVCSGSRVQAGINDLATWSPALAAEALFDPKAVSSGSNKSLPWKCRKGHEWNMTVAKRKAGGQCPYCSGKRVMLGFNDLATTHPDIAKEALFDPRKFTSQSNRREKWRCEKDHEWEALIYSRKRNGCPYCGGKAVLPGFNDLVTTDPKLASEALFDATVISRGSNRKLTWLCSLGHEYEAQVVNRLRGDGCPFCSGHQLLVGFNDLESRLPSIAAEALFDPKTVTSGSNKMKLWMCPEGHRFRMSPNKRSGGQGCPSCTKYGFSPEEDGWLYLVVLSEDARVKQIGITNHLDQRLDQHRRNGFTLKDQRGPMKGQAVREIERLLINYLNAQSIPIAKALPGVRFDGYTETFFDQKSVISDLYSLIQVAEEWEGEHK